MRRAGKIFFLCWTLLIGTGLFYSVQSVITGRPIPDQETDLRTTADSGESVAVVTTRMTALNDLRRAGLLTDEEYFQRRNSLLKSL